jgi:hypothetical protein
MWEWVAGRPRTPSNWRFSFELREMTWPVTLSTLSVSSSIILFCVSISCPMSIAMALSLPTPSLIASRSASCTTRPRRRQQPRHPQSCRRSKPPCHGQCRDCARGSAASGPSSRRRPPARCARGPPRRHRRHGQTRPPPTMPRRRHRRRRLHAPSQHPGGYLRRSGMSASTHKCRRRVVLFEMLAPENRLSRSWTSRRFSHASSSSTCL